jgi:hypothetical protein
VLSRKRGLEAPGWIRTIRFLERNTSKRNNIGGGIMIFHWMAWIGVAIHCCILVVVWRRAGKQSITASDRRLLSLLANFSPPGPAPVKTTTVTEGGFTQPESSRYADSILLPTLYWS